MVRKYFKPGLLKVRNTFYIYFYFNGSHFLPMIKEDAYKNHVKHYLAVDCVIFGYESDELKVLLYPRGFEPSVGKWSLLGGFVDGNETLGDAARRVLYNTTGLQHIYQEQVHAFSDIERDPAGRVISVAYYALIRINQKVNELIKSHGAEWWPVAKLPDLIFDHSKMVRDSLTRLQMKASSELIGNKLLGDTFSITQLKQLYEAIFQRSLDAGNFRKKVLSLGMLNNTGIKDKTDSKKGAYLYKYQPSFENVLNLTSIIPNL
jgi:8-oxo-dGTP diphosphatase